VLTSFLSSGNGSNHALSVAVFLCVLYQQKYMLEAIKSGPKINLRLHLFGAKDRHYDQRSSAKINAHTNKHLLKCRSNPLYSDRKFLKIV
jgi:hypothetical protein